MAVMGALSPSSPSRLLIVTLLHTYLAVGEGSWSQCLLFYRTRGSSKEILGCAIIYGADEM